MSWAQLILKEPKYEENPVTESPITISPHQPSTWVSCVWLLLHFHWPFSLQYSKGKWKELKLLLYFLVVFLWGLIFFYINEFFGLYVQILKQLMTWTVLTMWSASNLQAMSLRPRIIQPHFCNDVSFSFLPNY